LVESKIESGLSPVPLAVLPNGSQEKCMESWQIVGLVHQR